MRRPNGFTLVEILLVLTISALLLLTLFASLRTLGSATRATAAASTRSSDVQLVSTFLRKALMNARSQGVLASGNPAQPFTAFFHADADHLRWVGLLDAHHGGGLHFMQLSHTRIDGVDSAVLRFDSAPFNNGIFNGWPAGEPQVLLPAVDAFELAYQGGDGAWLAQWPPEKQQLPTLVRVRLTVNGRHWPELIYALAP